MATTSSTDYGCGKLRNYLAQLGKEKDAVIKAKEIVKIVLNEPDIYVFGELLSHPSVQALKTTHPETFEGLRIFTYGTYKDYVAEAKFSKMVEKRGLRKLRKITLATIAGKRSVVSYDILKKAVGIEDSRVLEKLILDCCNDGLFRGFIDQKHQRLETTWAFGRDVSADDMKNLAQRLDEWHAKTASVVKVLEDQIRASVEYHKDVDRRREKVGVDMQKTIREAVKKDKKDAAASTARAMRAAAGGMMMEMGGLMGARPY
eukprot:g2952.t1